MPTNAPPPVVTTIPTDPNRLLNVVVVEVADHDDSRPHLRRRLRHHPLLLPSSDPLGC